MADQAPLPYEFLPEVGSFSLTSDDIAEGERLANRHVFDDWGFSGENVSPHLRWEGFPAETRSFAVTVYDPDAPTISGFWHWQLWDISPNVTELPAGAGTPDSTLGVQSRNDFGRRGYGGPAPNPGPPHRYIFSVHALDTESLGIDGDFMMGAVGFNIVAHTLARATIVALYQAP